MTRPMGAMKRLLGLFGLTVEYVSEWGVYGSRYEAIDWHMSRPIHRNMSVAPPWAKTRFVRQERHS